MSAFRPTSFRQVAIRTTVKLFVVTCVVAAFTPSSSLRANESDSTVMCEWEDDDYLSANEYAHSRECNTMPPEGEQNDWEVHSYGHWTNAHSTWVYTTIANEPGDHHSNIS